MSRKHSFNLIHQALIGFVALAFAGGAGAVINLDNSEGAVVFAKQTISKASAVEKDGRTYYLVTGVKEALDVSAKVGVSVGRGGTIGLIYDFEGMVLNAAPSIAMTQSDGVTNIAVGMDIVKGGTQGDKSVSFLVTAPKAAAIAADAIVTLAFTSNQVAISLSMPVSISMMARSGSDGPFGSQEHRVSRSSAITAANGLVETAMPMTATASVADHFMLFKGLSGGVRVASVGSFMVGPNTNTVTAADKGAAVALITDIIGSEKDTETNYVVFSGDFSFAEHVELGPAGGMCPAAPGGTNLMRSENNVVMDDLAKVNLGMLAMPRNLCIFVRARDDAMAVAIPETDAYTIAAMYSAPSDVTDPAYPTVSHSFELGHIMRDGTTVRIPYLTQFANYNQRIAITNRGRMASYEFTFATEDGVTATPGALATGMLSADSVIYISLQNHDLVTIEGPFNRAVATLTVASEPRNIDVVVSQTNANGGTDTIEYTDN